MISNTNKQSAGAISLGVSRKKKWKNLTRFQKKWIMEKTHRLYTQFLTEKHWIPHCSERRLLIEDLYNQIHNKGIIISKGEICRILDYRMRKWNRNHLQRELEKARQKVLQSNNEIVE